MSLSLLDPALIRGQVRKICESPEFRKSRRLIQFLEYSSEKTLSGDSGSLKEFCIAVEVFGRSSDYDPKLDAVVRVEARRLRQKLALYYQSDGAQDQIIVEMPTGGYRLEVRQSGHVESSKEISTVGPHKWFSKDRIIIALSLLSFICMLFLGLSSNQPSPSNSESLSSRIVPPRDGAYLQASFSRDGRSLLANWQDQFRLGRIGRYHLESGNFTLQFGGDGHALAPAESPAGPTRVAYLLAKEGQTQLMIDHRERCKIENWQLRWMPDASQMRQGFGPTWSPDGQYVAIPHRVEPGVKLAIFRLLASSGPMQQLTFPPDHQIDYLPAYAPSGEAIAFVREESRGVNDVYLVNLVSGQERRLTQDRKPVSGLNWWSRNELLIASARDGLGSLWLLNMDTGKMSRTGSTAENPLLPSVHWQSSRVVYSSIARQSSIWRRRVGKGSPELILGGVGENHSPQISPDGRSLAFVSNRTGQHELWLADRSNVTATAKPVTSFRSAVVGSPRWSPDSSSIALDARPGGNASIYLFHISTGRLKKLRNNSDEEKIPSWSRDGSSVYFSSNKKGKVRLVKINLENGAEEVVVNRPAYDSFETNQHLYFVDGNPGLHVRGSSSQMSSPVSQIGRVQLSRYLTATPNGNLFFLNDGWLTKFSAGHLTRLVPLDGQKVYNSSSLTVSPDEQWVYWSRMEQPIGVLGLLEPKR